MKVFITGATGVLGLTVTRRLVSQGIKVVALSRSSANSDLLQREKAEVKEGDLFNQDDMTKATRGCDAILHLATSIPRKSLSKLSDWQTNDRIRVEGTKNLLNAALANGIELFLCESITAVYGQQNGNLVTTTTPLPSQQVAMVKSAVEMEKLITGKLPGKYIIFRFANFYSENDFFTNTLLENVVKGRMPILGSGNFYMNWIHVKDAADSIVYALNNIEKLKGSTINVTDHHPLLYIDMIKHISFATTKKKPYTLPYFFAKLVLGKNNFAFLTNSYRVKEEPLLAGWQPQHKDFITGITHIINETINLSTKSN